MKRKTSSRLQARNKIAGMTRGTGQNRFKLLREAGEFAVRVAGVCFGVALMSVLACLIGGIALTFAIDPFSEELGQTHFIFSRP